MKTFVARRRLVQRDAASLLSPDPCVRSCSCLSAAEPEAKLVRSELLQTSRYRQAASPRRLKPHAAWILGAVGVRREQVKED